jgi:dolichyl-phosphate-mannose-protein mannosyltransferase
LILAILCVIGIGLRVARFDKLAIEHFDEGVYASNVFAEQLAPLMGTDVYPSRHLYAPPLFPWLCEIAVRLGGTPDAAIWVNLLFGSLMIPLVWCVARDQLGLVAAIVAAGLCATSDYHIFFSRSALTDISLGFWLLLAVWLAARGIQSGRGLELIGAGVAAALAWWTKYNGWLAVLIPLGGAGLAWGMDRLMRAKVVEPGASALPLTRSLGRWSVIAVVSALLWSPVLYDLQSVGGYASVAANHKTYLVGFAGWWNGVQMHMGYLGLLTSVVGAGGVAFVAVALFASRGETAITVAAAMLVIIFPLIDTGAGLTWGCIAFLAICLVAKGWKFATLESRVFGAMLIVWWLGLTLSTPLYRPYARLSLPWLVASWLLVGIACEWLASIRLVHWKGYLGLISLPGSICLLAQLIGPPETLNGSHFSSELPMPAHRTGIRTIVGQITHEIDMARESMKPSQATGYDAAVYVVGEPALYCHLCQATQDRFVIVPGPSMAVATPLGGTYLPKFIATGSHVPEAEIEAALGSGQIEAIWEQNIPVSDMVAIDSAGLDEVTYRGPRKGRGLIHNTIKIRVFRIRD